jgi:hypothetical protein
MWSMDLVDRLVARAHGTSPMSAGPFSDLAADTRDDRWIDHCVNDSSDMETVLATELLLRALHTADSIVAEIESQGMLRQFFAGTSRDILLYESLFFSVHALSDALRQSMPMDKLATVSHFQDVACLTTSILGGQFIGEFDAVLHSQERTQRYLPHAGKLREMTERLIDIFISARGSTVIEMWSVPADEIEIEIEVNLRSAVSAAVDVSINENAEKLLGRYMGPIGWLALATE